MIYLDTSVALAWILGEDRRPPASLWGESLVSSRLLEYELLVRLNSYGMTPPREEAAREVLARLAFVELLEPVLERALQPFPVPVRTLDALHLATFAFLDHVRSGIELATYADRMAAAAIALGLRLHPLP